MSIKSKLKSVIAKTPGLRVLYDAYLRRTYSLHQTYQEEFVAFIAKKRRIDLSRAHTLVTTAQKQFIGGWGGDDYRHFTELALETFRPLYDEGSEAELIETYKFHSGFDFLRMVGYGVPNPQDIELIVSRLSEKKTVDLVDYGCGLAHRTIAISRHLLAKGVKVKLHLVDIRREQHLAFLDFLCRKYGIDYEFIEISPKTLYPELPAHDYCDNVSVLEHIRQPVTVVNNTDQALRPGGLFLALVDDTIEEMMHISPNLKAVRERLADLHYQLVARCNGIPLFQKPLPSANDTRL